MEFSYIIGYDHIARTSKSIALQRMLPNTTMSPIQHLRPQPLPWSPPSHPSNDPTTRQCSYHDVKSFRNYNMLAESELANQDSRLQVYTQEGGPTGEFRIYKPVGGPGLCSV
jgi:hypothetical protein